jgi:hypothetical protein
MQKKSSKVPIQYDKIKKMQSKLVGQNQITEKSADKIGVSRSGQRIIPLPDIADISSLLAGWTLSPCKSNLFIKTFPLDIVRQKCTIRKLYRYDLRL